MKISPRVPARQRLLRARTQGKRVGQARAKQMFLKWLEKRDPFLYKTSRRVATLRRQNLSGMGEIDWGGLFESATETIKTALPTYLQTRQQKQILDIQMDRAKQGLPPLETTQYTAPIQISPTITPETEAAMNRVAVQTVSSGVGKMAPWLIGGGLVLALILLRKK